MKMETNIEMKTKTGDVVIFTALDQDTAAHCAKRATHPNHAALCDMLEAKLLQASAIVVNGKIVARRQTL